MNTHCGKISAFAHRRTLDYTSSKHGTDIGKRFVHEAMMAARGLRKRIRLSSQIADKAEAVV